MSKLEEIKKLQEYLPKLQEKMSSLGQVLNNISDLLGREQFVPETENERARDILREINETQNNFFKEYQAVMTGDIPTGVAEVKEAVNKAQATLEEKAKFYDLVKFINCIHSKNEKYEKIIDDLRSEINSMDIDALPLEVLEGDMSKFVSVKKTYETTDFAVLITCYSELGSWFDNNFIGALAGKQEFYVEEVVERTSVVEDVLTGQQAEELVDDTTATEVEKIKDVPVLEKVIDGKTEETITTLENIAEESVVEGTPVDEDAQEENDVEVKLSPLLEVLYIDSALNTGIIDIKKNKDAKPFKVGDFESTLKACDPVGMRNAGKDNAARLFRLINDAGVITQDLAINDANAALRFLTPTILKKLHNEGYLAKASVKGFKDIYYLTSRGLKAIGNPTVKKMFDIKKSRYSDGIGISNYINVVAYAESNEWLTICYNENLDDGEIYGSHRCCDKYFFTIGAKGVDRPHEKRPCIYALGAFPVDGSEEEIAEELQNVFERLKSAITDFDIIVFIGQNLEKVRAFADWAIDNLEDKEKEILEGKRALLKTIESTDLYDYYTGEKIENTDIFALGLVSVEQNISTEKNDSDNTVESDDNPVVNVEEKSTPKQKDTSVTEEVLSGEDKVTEVELKTDEQEPNSESIEENPSVEVEETPIQCVPEEISHNPDDESEQEYSETEKLSEDQYDHYIEEYKKMVGSGKLYAAAAYLKYLSGKYDEFKELNRKFAYAVNEPSARCIYNSDSLMNEMLNGVEETDDHMLISAVIRALFLDQYGYDYSIKTLLDILKGNSLLERHVELGKIIHMLSEYKNKHHCGMDKFADYRSKGKEDYAAMLKNVSEEAKKLDYFLEGGNKNTYRRNGINHPVLKETRKIIFGENSYFSIFLKEIVKGTSDPGTINMIKDFLKTFIKDNAPIDFDNIDDFKVDQYLDDNWNEAKHSDVKYAEKGDDFINAFRLHLKGPVEKFLEKFCEYVSICDMINISEDGDDAKEYRNKKKDLLALVEDGIKNAEKDFKNGEYTTTILLDLLNELKTRITGSFDNTKRKFFYIGFLGSNHVLLDENYYPYYYDEFSIDLPNLSFDKRVEKHMAAIAKTLEQKVEDILAGEDNYGSLELILKYFAIKKPELREKYDDDIFSNEQYARETLEHNINSFRDDIELRQSYGQLTMRDDSFKESMLLIIDRCKEWAEETRNYGFFKKVTAEYIDDIERESKIQGQSLAENLENFCAKNSEWEHDEEIKSAVEKIRDRINSRNYTAAEDLLNRLENNDLDDEASVIEHDYLNDLINNYNFYYEPVKKPSDSMRNLLRSPIRNKEAKGASKILNSWINDNDSCKSENIRTLLDALGFRDPSVEVKAPIKNKFVNAIVKLGKAINGRKINYKHPVPVFGSKAEDKGFRVVFVFGNYSNDADMIIETFKEIGDGQPTMVFFDCAISLPLRRKLARKCKEDLTNVFAIVDRVVINYIIKKYQETSVQKILMSLIMPFAYYQPYVAESSNDIPQEMFIGRKEELAAIEKPGGINIVYGGRQLGKSALLRMAKKDINNNENGDRAVRVEIKGKKYEEAALEISRALTREHFFDKQVETKDWNELSNKIKDRLSDERPGKKIPYFLLLIDEADAFIESSAAVNYMPFDCLKDIQNMEGERFKFVVAGLRDVIRFNRECALSKNSVLTHFRSITVKPFKYREAKMLLELPLSYLGFRFNNDEKTASLISSIFSTTNYFPGLIQLYCTKLIEAMKNKYGKYNENETPAYVISETQVKAILGENELLEQIRDKFQITLEVDEDMYYYIIALIMSFRYHENKQNTACSPKDVLTFAEDYGIAKLNGFGVNKVKALMDEMVELNILQKAGEIGYRFSRYRFCKMMGTEQEINDKLMALMEGE